MRVTFQREPFLHAFQTASMVIPSRSPKPILQNVKLEADDSLGVITATDMEVAIRLEISGLEVETSGSVLLPVDRFGPILRESTDEKLSIDADSQGAVIKGDRSEFKLPAASPHDFPTVSSFEEQQYHEVPARLLKELIRRTLFATDTESSRYALGGVLLEMDTDKITAVGTDGRRLAKMEGPALSVGDHNTGDAMTIVPARSMQLIERALSDADAEVRVATRANDIVVQSPRAVITSRLVEGRFPKWRDVIPQRSDALKIDLTVGPVHSALRQAAIVVNEESRGIDFTIGEGSLVLAATTAEVGQSRVELPISYSDAPITVTLDHRFVGDFLKVLDPDKTFTLEIENAETAALCTTEDGYSYVIMPLARDRK